MKKEFGIYYKLIKMNVTELRTYIGKFGMLTAGESEYEKTLPGWIKDIDTRGSVWFVDTDGYGFAFKANKIKSFVEKEFKPTVK